jgi:ABC-type transport system substrate-binding protein
MRCIPNPNTMTQQVLQNELDFASIPQKDQFIQSLDHANVKARKVKLVSYDYPAYRYIGYNLKRELFKDRRVRTALAYAVPMQQIIDQVFQGLAKQIAGPFLPGSTAYDDTVEPITFDLEKAKLLLEEAGWVDTDEDGIRDKTIDGVKVPARYDLMIYSDAPAYRTIAEIIKENNRKIGVEVLVSPAKWALMLQKLNKKEFDAAMLGWALPWKQDPFQVWHGSQADIPDSSNHIGYRNPELDKLIDQLRITLDPEKQAELYHKIHRIIYEDQPYTFLFVDKATAGYDMRLQNVKFYKIRPCLDSREWFSQKPRAVGR